jgi:hypothetical protein
VRTSVLSSVHNQRTRAAQEFDRSFFTRATESVLAYGHITAEQVREACAAILRAVEGTGA